MFSFSNKEGLAVILLVLLWATSHLAEGWNVAPGTNRIQYTREFLLGLRPAGNEVLRDFPNLVGVDYSETGYNYKGPRKRGRRGGLRERVKRQSLSRIPLPSIILSNARSLRNKIDELQAHVRYQHEFKDACILALSESWLDERDKDCELELDGFGAPLRMDREEASTGKTRGGGVCLYVNKRWCKTVIVRERLCTKDIELLSVSLRPKYLPREFPQIFVTVIYINPKANESAATEIISQTVLKLQSLSPDAPNLVLGDFNHCSLDKTLKTFYRYVTCPTRNNKILDQCYGSIKGAYKSLPLPPLSTADHNCVQLLPAYRTCLQRGKVVTKKVKLWTEEATQTLQGCLDCTAWDEFVESSQDINELTDVTSSWLGYCVDTVIPEKVVKVYPNNKPWVTKNLQALLNRKKRAFKLDNLSELNGLQREIKCEIKRAKLAYKQKVEDKLSSNSLGSAWDSVKTMVGLNDKTKKRVSLEGFHSDQALAEELNKFYSRFDVHDFSKEIADLKQSLSEPSAPTPSFSVQSVENTFKHCKARTSPGPDNITSRMLINCAEQLAPIFAYIFNMSLYQQRVPDLWKQSIIVPIAKISRPKAQNDYRPVALTSLVMKSFEKLVKRELMIKTEHLLDPLQFAYRCNRGVQDATLTLLNLVFKHLDGHKNHARLLFVDFSSAFNTLQPHLLVQKLIDEFELDKEIDILGWTLDFLTNRSQRVRVNGHLSELTSTSTGSPQGCVLSPLLYILFTNDCRSVFENHYILKFADDSVIVSLLNDAESSYGPVLEYFSHWCTRALLELNIAKTKDMPIDFRRPSPNPTNCSLNDQNVEIVESYKYLGTIIDNRLSFESNTNTICKKSQQRLFCLRKLAKFGVDRSLMSMFYRSFIESILTFSFICWYASTNLKQKSALNKVVKVSSKITGTQQNSLTDLFNSQVLRKADLISRDGTHPLNPDFQLLPSGFRYKCPIARTNRYKHSFIPTAVTLLNTASSR